MFIYSKNAKLLKDKDAEISSLKEQLIHANAMWKNASEQVDKLERKVRTLKNVKK
jgi:hypothetical protein